MIRAVLFDLDDTILDFHLAESTSLSKTLKRLGIDPSKEIIELYSSINRHMWELLEKGEIDRKSLLTKRFELLFNSIGADAQPFEAQKIYEEYLSRTGYFMPLAEKTLEELCGKYTLYLVSNGNARVQEGRLNTSGIRKYFRDIFISENIGWDKPSPKFFDCCFERMGGVPRDESIIIGDSLSSDILGGINAGIHTCWYNPRGAELRPGISPEYTISSLGEAAELLRGM